MRTLDGVGVTPQSGIGTATWYDDRADLPEPPDPHDIDPEAEWDRFENARNEARTELERERERVERAVGAEEAAVFEAHVQFLDDPQITENIESGVEEGLPAEHAVKRAFVDGIEQFESMAGRTAERADDLRDVRDRLLHTLTDGERVDLASLPEGTVLLAERLTPSDTVQLDPERIAGFATALGGRTSHAAIFARAIGLPAVVGVGDALADVEAGTGVGVDGEAGTILVEPDDESSERLADAREVTIRHEPVSTTDGTHIEVAANLGRPAELDGARAAGADGVGLFRTEFLFLDRDAPPDEDEQYEAYLEACTAFDGRVVVRTLDVGGDKPIPYLDQPEETNPFLGERGIRRSLGLDGELFETQLRALLRAGAGAEPLSVMFPLVATVEELDTALDTVEQVTDDLANEEVEHAMPELGVMIETPASVLVAAELAARVDFLSIGTNDLAQYTMAASRENERVATLHDARQPSVLRAIRRTVEAGHEAGAWVGMCGEMAGDPALTELLVGLGLDELSMSAVTIPDVKAAVAEIDRERARERAERALVAETKDDVLRVLDD
ncbi:phosphoenolpyruvate--protein phosphotransferase [Halococcus saccharolyticus]|uniref:Phosphoenolpyruvate-protein phosphotransferase n=1 Tax=Halococcus saccharolyticus DSM 5350 TaxID=1227455 RepID=M0MG21_9EURY|nr:phosphoenolpyruvate--protein phosphotransferase [Halococcus saccharolyticus]EMA44672.1 phosphoenolpyruvate-protein phosphotransferase [Halococcus saccharolyticus DSM 5350]